MSSSNNTTKDTVYVDVDDEITNIIDKVRGSDKRIVALVLPKRAMVLQSIVNMKLLKRTADGAKKRVVLITSEAGLLPLAGAVGLHVAKNLQSKPVIPAAPDAADMSDAEVDADELEDETPDRSRSVGELSGGKPAAQPLPEPEDTIELDNSEDALPAAAAGAKPKKKGKFKVPNFERFRLLVLLGGLGVVLLLVGLYLAIFVMPKAKVIIKTDSVTVNSNISFTASTTAQELEAEDKVLPAKRLEVKKTESEKVSATGQKDVGTKASGSVRMSIPCATVNGTPPTIPAGTGVSANSLTFITQQPVSLTTPDFTGGCNFVGTTSVVAQKNGDQYNLGEREYTVAGFSQVKASGDAMSGGSSKMIKVVSQTDIDTARQKLTSKTSEGAADELKNKLEDEDYMPLADSLLTADPAITNTPAVDTEASDVTVTSVTTHSMIGIKEDDLKKLIEDDAKKQIDTSKQSILDNGIKDASFVIQEGKKGAAQVPITVQAAVKAGPQLDTAGIKREISGKKKGEAANIVQNRPAIKEVNVELSPFWVTKVPSKPGKITILFDQSNGDAKP